MADPEDGASGRRRGPVPPAGVQGAELLLGVWERSPPQKLEY